MLSKAWLGGAPLPPTVAIVMSQVAAGGASLYLMYMPRSRPITRTGVLAFAVATPAPPTAAPELIGPTVCSKCPWLIFYRPSPWKGWYVVWECAAWEWSAFLQKRCRLQRAAHPGQIRHPPASPALPGRDAVQPPPQSQA